MTENSKLEIDVQREWEAGNCPIVDGIIYPDGRVKRMVVEWVPGLTGRLEVAVKPAEWTTLTALAAVEPLQLTGIIPLCDCYDTPKDFHVLGGEGGHGSNGFLALAKVTSGKVLWIAFFNESNPFETVELVNNQAVAKTNLGTLWRFPLDSPENLSLGC